MDKRPSLTTARLRRRVPVLICRKCLKRAAHGPDTKKALKDALKRRGRDQGTKPRLIATACFGICPKRAIVAASGETLARGETLVIADASMAEDAAMLLLPDRSDR